MACRVSGPGIDCVSTRQLKVTPSPQSSVTGIVTTSLWEPVVQIWVLFFPYREMLGGEERCECCRPSGATLFNCVSPWNKGPEARSQPATSLVYTL